MKEPLTLIIHPEDSSTDFLKPIYLPLKNKVVINHGSTDELLKEKIKSSDRVMLMGHGTPSGLLHVGKFISPSAFVIDNRHLPILQQKINSIYIWCNADQFVEKYDLKGFYTGMFISEIHEASYCGLGRVSQGMIDESNDLFSKLVSDIIEEDVFKIHAYLSDNYKKIVASNPVALYNYQRLYVR